MDDLGKFVESMMRAWEDGKMVTYTLYCPRCKIDKTVSTEEKIKIRNNIYWKGVCPTCGVSLLKLV